MNTFREAYDHLSNLNDSELERWIVIFLAFRQASPVAIRLGDRRPFEALCELYRDESNFAFQRRIEEVVTRVVLRYPEGIPKGDTKGRVVENALHFIRETMMYQVAPSLLVRMVQMAQDGRLREMANRKKGVDEDLHGLLLAILSFAQVEVNVSGLHRWTEFPEYREHVDRLLQSQVKYQPEILDLPEGKEPIWDPFLQYATQLYHPEGLSFPMWDAKLKKMAEDHALSFQYDDSFESSNDVRLVSMSRVGNPNRYLIIELRPNESAHGTWVIFKISPQGPDKPPYLFDPLPFPPLGEIEDVR